MSLLSSRPVPRPRQTSTLTSTKLSQDTTKTTTAPRGVASRARLMLALLAFLLFHAPTAQAQTRTTTTAASPTTTTTTESTPDATDSTADAQDDATAPASSDTTRTGGGGTNLPTTNQNSSQPNTNLDKLIRVTEVYNLAHEASDRRDRDGILHRRKAPLNNIIMVRVQNLEALLKRAKCLEPFEATPCREQEISLFLNGRVIRGLVPESGAPELDNTATTTTTTTTAPASAQQQTTTSTYRNGTLRYHLQRVTDTPEDQADTDEHWADLLGFSLNPRDWSFERAVNVSVGLADEYPYPTDVRTDAPKDKKFYLVRIPTYRIIFWVVFMLACLFALYHLARRSDLLRDRASVLWGQRKPYSLSACQAAWWFVLILLSFVFIWLITGQLDLSPTALILLSIGLGTALGSTVIDANKRAQTANEDVGSDELKTLMQEKAQMEEELTDAKARLRRGEITQADFDAKKRKYDILIADIKQKFPAAIGSKNEVFYLDIISDANGVSFHRFQMMIWTLVLGIIFLHSVLSRLSMPEFSATLLGLMGVSAGTYLGFKFPENSNTPEANAGATTDAGDAAGEVTSPPSDFDADANGDT